VQPSSDAGTARPVRCAIYARKSTEEGLEQDFNSLDAQRECAEAYVLSQRHERWTALAQRYDDGGFSGANLERPALRQLLADVEAGAIDCVVVYKVDRLSRSLLDFARIMEVLDRRGVSFVSVTQQLNTRSPMGRLTLNVLLSFAEFEREIISERTRDKISAARRKGKWMGGCPPLGYHPDPVTRKLTVNQTEAEQVRSIFAVFVRCESLADTLDEIERRGWKTKAWTTRKDKQRAGARFDRLALVRLLTNELYIGKVSHKGQAYPGEQEAIVDHEIWTKANELLKNRKRGRNLRRRKRQAAILEGLLECAICRRSMGHGYTTKRGRRYRYYLCQRARKGGAKACPGQMISARRIENVIVVKLYQLASQPGSPELEAIFPVEPGQGDPQERAHQRRLLESLIERIRYDHRVEQAYVRLKEGGSQGGEVPVRVRKSPFDRRDLLPLTAKPVEHLPRTTRLMALAIRFEGLLKEGVVQNYTHLARREGVSTTRISQVMKLRHLAPVIQGQLLFLTEEAHRIPEPALRRIAEEMDWRRQVKMFAEL
jgi:site-specific DNA recombinase